jgi:hypothetical protein
LSRIKKCMPTLYVYLGICVLFFSNEHEPIHVHGRYQNMERKAEIIVRNGVVVDIVFKHVKGRKQMSLAQQLDFETLERKKADDIVKQ